jgi:hypothetical protein
LCPRSVHTQLACPPPRTPAVYASRCRLRSTPHRAEPALALPCALTGRSHPSAPISAPMRSRRARAGSASPRRKADGRWPVPDGPGQERLPASAGSRRQSFPTPFTATTVLHCTTLHCTTLHYTHPVDILRARTKSLPTSPQVRTRLVRGRVIGAMPSLCAHAGAALYKFPGTARYAKCQILDSGQSVCDPPGPRSPIPCLPGRTCPDALQSSLPQNQRL